MHSSRLPAFPALPALAGSPAVPARPARPVRPARPAAPSASPAGRQSRAVAALAAAGVAWGTSVPLSKAALAWLPPAWLVAFRFVLAAAVLLTVLASTRRGAAALRAALRWPVLAWGAAGFGGSVLLQNAGLAATSVTHAALLIGTGPVLVAVIAAAWHRDVARPVAWAGFTVSLGGVALVASGGGGGASGAGDALVLLSVLLSAAVTVAQARLLRGQDPAAVTAVLFLGAAAAALPAAAVTGGLPSAPPPGGAGLVAVLAVLGLAVIGTIAPFTLFAYGQRRVSTEVAGAFLNLEPLVGALAGVAFFGDPAGPRLLAGGAAILGGILMSSLPALRDRRTAPRPAVPGAAHTVPTHTVPTHTVPSST
jgi:O-acetylserine/cysteine efflux transporter